MSEWRSFPYWVGQMTVRVMFVAGWACVIAMSAVAGWHLGELIRHSLSCPR